MEKVNGELDSKNSINKGPRSVTLPTSPAARTSKWPPAWSTSGSASPPLGTQSLKKALSLKASLFKSFASPSRIYRATGRSP